MSEPTIEECRNWVIAMENNLATSSLRDSRVGASLMILKTIHAILEQHEAILKAYNQPVPYPEVMCEECGTGFSEEGWKRRFE